MRATNSTYQYRTMSFTLVQNYLLDVMYGGEGGEWTSEQPVNNQRATSNEGIYQVFARQVPSTLMWSGRSTDFAELPISSCTAHTGSFTITFAMTPGSDPLHSPARTRQVPICMISGSKLPNRREVSHFFRPQRHTHHSTCHGRSFRSS